MKQLNNLNDLRYGQLNIEDLEFVQTAKPKLDKIISRFLNKSYPDIATTQKEIEYIKTIQKAYSEKEENLDFCKDADEDLDATMQELCDTINVKIPKTIFKKVQTLGYIVVKLKQHYQRPRPYQVAYYTEQFFHPFETISGNPPAYPSGHALQGYYMASLLKEKHPKHSEQLDKFAVLIAESRIALGVHYPSDNEFSKEICDEIVKNKLL